MIPRLVIATILFFAAWQLGTGLATQGKAWLGQVLIERAWGQGQTSGQPVRPWPWAPTHPVARLHAPRLEIDRLVLAGADEANLAWAPGLEKGPHGHWMMAAHRDTHFAFLRDVIEGDLLITEMLDGQSRQWRVVSRQIVDSNRYLIDLGLPDDRLTLVTCYPFDALRAGGPLRLLLVLKPAHREMAPESDGLLAWQVGS